MGTYHIPVLLNEVLEYLNVREGKKYIDCTLGGGGHSVEIVRRGGIVLSLDQDEEAISFVKQKIEDGSWKLDKDILDRQWYLRKGNFGKLGDLARDAGFGKVSGILFDLGVSSHQLDTDYRGFSFNKEAKLDMRMDASQGITALDLINAGSEEELSRLFWKFGEERFAKRIAREIVRVRQIARQTGRLGVETTNELAEIITKIRPKTKGDRMHPATRVFQALRVAVNSELDNLTLALEQASELLDVGGRLVVISFHSLEDRIVKNYLKDHTDLLRILTDKPVVATEEEIMNNPRARSGKLRAGEKLPNKSIK